MGDDYVDSSDSAVIRATFRLYGSIYLASMAVYVGLRRLYPKLFKIRSFVPEVECELAKKDYGWFDYGVMSVSDDDLLESCGLDAVCFLRALRVGRRLALLGCFNAAWLIPLYYTSDDDSTTKHLSDPFVLISIANLPSSSPRFIATVLAAYILFLYAFLLVYYEYTWLTRYRHKYLALPTPANYAVYVSGIPKQYRSSSGLASYFRSCSSHSSVLEACVARNIESLEAKVARREAIAQKLEHSVAVEQQQGKVKTHRRLSLRSGRLQRVESVAVFSNQLKDLDAEITAEIDRLRTIDSFDDDLDNRDLNDASASLEFNGRQRSFSVENFRGRLFSRDRLFSKDRRGSVGSFGDDLDDELQQILKSAEFSPGLCNRSDSRRTGLESITESNYGLPSRDNRVGRSFAFSGPFIDGDGSDLPEDMSSRRYIDDQEIDDCLGSLHESDDEMNTVSLVSVDNNRTEDYNPDDILEASGPECPQDPPISCDSPPLHSKSFGLNIINGKKVVGASVRMAGSIRKTSVVASKAATSVVTKTVNPKNISKGFKVAQTLGESVVISAGTVVPMLASVTKSAGDARDAGFVVFTRLYDVQAALQMIHHPKANVMDVEEAPAPHDIFWRNVGLPHHARRVGFILSTGSCAVLCIFWSFPTAFISSLAQVDSLKRTLPRFGAWIEEVPRMEVLLAVLAPLLLLMSNELLLPGLLRWFATWEGHVSAARLESSLFLKLGVFMIIQTFFVSLVSGSVTSEIYNILNDPASIINYLSISLPSQSSYFIQYLTTTTFLLQAAETLRLYALGGALLRRFVGPRGTENERKRPWMWLYPLESPPQFWHAETFAQIILYYMIFFVYATIAPVICFFLWGYFLLMEHGYRYQLIHNFPISSDSGGKCFKYFLQFLLGSMIIAQLTLIGLLLLKECVYATPVLGLLIGITLLYIAFVNGKHAQVSEHLPSRDCVIHDSRFADEGRSFDFVSGAYLQPALHFQPGSIDLGTSSHSLGKSESKMDSTGDV